MAKSARHTKRLNVRILFSSRMRQYDRAMLFETPQEELTDEEVAAVLRQTFGRWAKQRFVA